MKLTGAAGFGLIAVLMLIVIILKLNSMINLSWYFIPFIPVIHLIFVVILNIPFTYKKKS